MAQHPATKPQSLARRIVAALRNQPFAPQAQPATRMPDLETWKMPHRAVDVKDWELALNMANNVLRPDRTKLVDLYDSILVDSHTSSVMESRVLRVVRSKFRLVATDGKPDPEKTRLLEAQWFEDFLQYVAEAVFRGHTLIELSELVKPGQLKRITRIDQRNVLPWTGVVVRRRGEETGYRYREEPLASYLIEVGQPFDLGLLSQVAPVVITKKYAIGSWSDFVEKFGIPPRWVKTPSTDRKRLEQLETMLQNMVSSAYGIIQGTEEIQVMQTPGVDAHKVFDELISRMNSEISKRILGQDGTSDNKDASGTYGSLKVLQSVAEDRHQADKASVMYVINEELFPRLIKLGYPLAGVRFEWDELRDLSALELVDAATKLGSVFEIDPDYMAERTGIKIIGIKRAPGEISDNPGTGRQSGKKKGEGGAGNELDDDDEDEDGVTASWPSRHVQSCAVCGGARGITAEADVPPIDQSALDSLLRSAWDGERFDHRYFDSVASIYQSALNQIWNPTAQNIAYDAPDHVAHALMQANIFRFGGVKTLSLVLDVNALAKEGGTYGDFKRRVDESGLMRDYNTDYLRTEHVNVVMTGIQAQRYHAMQRSADVLPFGEYVTMEDDRVRPAHAALNGKMWPLGHEAWRTIWPPNGWRCRCTVLPTQEGPTGAAADKQWDEAQGRMEQELARMKRQGFNGNRAVTGEAFKLNKAYIATLKTAQQRSLKLNDKESYGRSGMDFDSIMSRPLPSWSPQLRNEAAMKRWHSSNSNGEGVVLMNDYAGRPWVMRPETIDLHTGGKYTIENRHEFLHLVPQVISAPDEVWLRAASGGSTEYYFIKYYTGKPVVARADVKSTGLEVTSWYELVKDKAARVRNGVLVKKMPVGT